MTFTYTLSVSPAPPNCVFSIIAGPAVDLSSCLIADAGTYTITVTGTLTGFTQTGTFNFDVTVIDPCLAATVSTSSITSLIYTLG